MVLLAGCTTAVWQNLGFQTFDDYLVFSNQRRNIKREQSCGKSGLRLQTLTGDEIPKSCFL